VNAKTPFVVDWEDMFGPVVEPDGVTFRLWAPDQPHVEVELVTSGVRHRLEHHDDGWFRGFVPGCGPGTLYRFVLARGQRVPDPASRYQPQGVHGPSQVFDAGHFTWSDAGWTGRPWHETVYYELHVGTFTQEGTYLAAIDRLDDLRDLGITALQIMPLADFAGRWGWGYDGVDLYAPARCYGTPDDLRALVDAAHRRNLMVSLDVVYNHFGPEGNYLQDYAPLHGEKGGEWGETLNFDGPGSLMVRRFIIENAVYWLRDFHLDGLRLDAVHAIHDGTRPTVVEALADTVHEALPGRTVHLVVENSDNDADILERQDDLRPKRYTAQWNDDSHHPLHVLGTGETISYYIDYADASALLARAMTAGFAFQGEGTPRDPGTPKGKPSAHLPPTAFISYISNHDQVGNRPSGDRLHHRIPLARVKALATINLLSPSIPLIFMGEEFASSKPFPYFTDVPPELHEIIHDARRDQLADFPEVVSGLALPTAEDPATFEAARLEWSERDEGIHAEMLALYRSLLEARARDLVPLIDGCPGHAGSVHHAERGCLWLSWRLAGNAVWHMRMNLADTSAAFDVSQPGRVVERCGSATDSVLGPWSVMVTCEDADPA